MEVLEEKERKMLNLENTLEETLEAFELFVVDAEKQFKEDYAKAQDLYKQIDHKISENVNVMTKAVSKDIELKAKELLEMQNKLLDEEKNRLKIMEQEAISKVIREKKQLEQQREQIVKQTEGKQEAQDLAPEVPMEIKKSGFSVSLDMVKPESTNENDQKEKPHKEEKKIKVLELANQGLNVDEIAKTLDLTKGETKFILQINSYNQ